MFRAPSSSPPPSTPESHRSSKFVPSTTPAGQPPPDSTTNPSSTPLGPPPPKPNFFSSAFGASNTRPAFNFNSTFNSSAAPGSSPPKSNVLSGVGSGSFGVPTSARPTSQRGRSGFSFRPPSKSPGMSEDEEDEEDGDAEDEDEEDEEDTDYEEDEEEGEPEDEDMEDEQDMEDDEMEDDRMDEDEKGSSEESDDVAPPRKRNLQKSSRSSILMPESSSPRGAPAAAKRSQHDLLRYAKNLTAGADRIEVHEPDEIILGTEGLMTKLHDSLNSDTPEKRSEVLGDVAQDLVALWQGPSTGFLSQSLSSSGRSAPSPVANASRLVSLLLGIHYPSQPHQRGSALSSLSRRVLASDQFTPIPKVLLDWMDAHHKAPSEIEDVLAESRGFSAHEGFWDAVQFTAFRGKLDLTEELLGGARFERAFSSVTDGLGDHGYQGTHLSNVTEAVNDALDLLHQCPATDSRFPDWDVKGQAWSIFRSRVLVALKNLQEFAEGNSRSRLIMSRSQDFGLSQSQNQFKLSTASRMAESNVPWTVYDGLTKLYKLLLGDEDEVLHSAFDWVDATLGLAIWWDGNDTGASTGSLNARRVRSVDVTPVSAYCQRLSASLTKALGIFEAEGEEELDITNKNQIGLAAIFDDNIEAVLLILRSWSLTVASAVAEVASGGDWFRRADGILEQFDQSDLMVLSYDGTDRSSISKDDLLTAYATRLASKPTISAEGSTTREGWELSLQILERMDDRSTAIHKINELLDGLSLGTLERVDKITDLCDSLGLSDQSRHIASKFADYLYSNSQDYGDIILYYARAHNAKKIQEVLQVLVSHCLVKSLAYPPSAQLDDRFRTLITSPKQILTDLARVDPEAAQLLSNHLSGYATIRKFYDLRDEDIVAKQAGKKPEHRPLARKRAAAEALMVIIASASSSIRGGLYDRTVETVVQVDVLLSLLGEALIFINQPKRTLTMSHLYSLLAAVEDLETAPSMIYAQCEECFSSTLSAAHGGKASSPRSQMQKSTSNLTTASSQYSIIGSTDLGSFGGRSGESSAVFVEGGDVNDAERAWDWRKGFRKDATGQEATRVLRLGIAQEIARAWADGETW